MSNPNDYSNGDPFGKQMQEEEQEFDQEIQQDEEGDEKHYEQDDEPDLSGIGADGNGSGVNKRLRQCSNRDEFCGDSSQSVISLVQWFACNRYGNVAGR